MSTGRRLPHQVGQYREAVTARQAEIEHAGVVGVIEQREAGEFAVAHPVDRIVTEFQAGDDAVAENRNNLQPAGIRNYFFSFSSFSSSAGNFLAPAAVGQLAARAGCRLERDFKMRARLGKTLMINGIFPVKKFGSIPSGLIDSDFLNSSSAFALSPNPTGQPGTLA